MYITEEEAKEKYCPVDAYNARIDGVGAIECCASKCMAWRREEHPVRKMAGVDYRGFCGLAGIPKEVRK